MYACATVRLRIKRCRGTKAFSSSTSWNCIFRVFSDTFASIVARIARRGSRDVIALCGLKVVRCSTVDSGPYNNRQA